MPCGETFARHALYSQRFYKENFGVTCKTGYTVDSFGHNANLPQLLKLGGMENFVFMRPGEHENPDLPPLFWWTSADGSKVLTYKITAGHYATYNDAAVEEKTNALRDAAKKDGNKYDLMCFYGVGNHGGGPTKRMLTKIDELKKKGADIKYSCPDEYFDTVRKQKPVIKEIAGELQMHAIGCYSVAGHIKAAQRKAEVMLIKAEKLNFMAQKLTGAAAENGRIQDAYKRLLFNTFHDIMCGCSIKDGLDAAMNEYAYAIFEAREIIDNAVIDISKNVDTMIEGYENFGKSEFVLWEEEDKGVPVMIFNTAI